MYVCITHMYVCIYTHPPSHVLTNTHQIDAAKTHDMSMFVCMYEYVCIYTHSPSHVLKNIHQIDAAKTHDTRIREFVRGEMRCWGKLTGTPDDHIHSLFEEYCSMGHL